MSRDNWRCLYGYEWYLLSYSLRVYSNFSVPLLWGFHSGEGAHLGPVSSDAAMVHNDGHDYVPTNKWVTFGHHFAAIAGAGPLVGPVIAAQFGYLPGALWILIGSVVAGAVHDMVILFASVRYDGKSIADIAREEISKWAGFGAMLATLFLLIITLAGGMAVVVANALHNSPPWGLLLRIRYDSDCYFYRHLFEMVASR